MNQCQDIQKKRLLIETISIEETLLLKSMLKGTITGIFGKEKKFPIEIFKDGHFIIKNLNSEDISYLKKQIFQKSHKIIHK